MGFLKKLQISLSDEIMDVVIPLIVLLLILLMLLVLILRLKSMLWRVKFGSLVVCILLMRGSRKVLTCVIGDVVNRNILILIILTRVLERLVM